MKHRGSTMEYAEERMNDIMRLYNEHISSCEYISIPHICKQISNMPSRKFWVSEIWASKIIMAIIKGKHPYYKMRPLKREMFHEIHKRVVELKKKNPHWSINKCCEIVVAQPAPKFYLSAGSIRIMICKEKKKRYEERKKRLQHCF